MAIIIPAGYAQVLIRLEDVSFTDGYALITGGVELNEMTLTQAATVLAEGLNDLAWLGGNMSAGTTITTATVQTETESAIANVDITGENEGAMLPTNCAMLVNKVTGLRGRRARGRNFWPNLIGEAEIGNSGYMSPAERDSWQANFDQYTYVWGVGTRQWVILQNDDGVSPPLAVPPTVTDHVVSQQIATQRRRMRR